MNVDYKQYDKDKPTLSKNMSYSGIQSNCVRKYLAKAHICFLVLYLLSAMPIFLGCDQREVALTTKRRVTWYNGGSQFVGISETMPTDVRDLDLDLKHCSFSVFWDIHGSLQEFSIKTPAMHAFFCKKLGKVIVPTLSDVLMISLDGTSTQRSLGEESAILPITAISSDTNKMLLTVSDGTQLCLVAIDLLKDQTTKYDIPGKCYGAVFINSNKVAASVNKDLYWIEFLEDGTCSMSIEKGAAEKGIVCGVYNETVIFYSTREPEEGEVLRFGATTVQFDQDLRFLESSDSHIYVVLRDGRTYEIDSQGSTSALETIGLGDIIGAGVSSSEFWIVDFDGYIKVFGSPPSERRISFPSNSET